MSRSVRREVGCGVVSVAVREGKSMSDKQLAELYKAMYDWALEQNKALTDCLSALCEGDHDRARAALLPLLPKGPA